MDLSVLTRALGVALLLLVGSLPAEAARLKDLVSVNGVRDNQIIGDGLVVGLAGTGDKQTTAFTVQSLGSLLARIGVGVNPDDISGLPILRRLQRLGEEVGEADLPELDVLWDQLETAFAKLSGGE